MGNVGSMPRAPGDATLWNTAIVGLALSTNLKTFTRGLQTKHSSSTPSQKDSMYTNLAKSSPILPLGIFTIMPLITKKHLLQLKLTLKQRVKSNEVGGKTCDCKMSRLPVSSASPHEAKYESMAIYKLGDAPSITSDLLDEGIFPHILEHQMINQYDVQCMESKKMSVASP